MFLRSKSPRMRSLARRRPDDSKTLPSTPTLPIIEPGARTPRSSKASNGSHRLDETRNYKYAEDLGLSLGCYLCMILHGTVPSRENLDDVDNSLLIITYTNTSLTR